MKLYKPLFLAFIPASIIQPCKAQYKVSSSVLGNGGAIASGDGNRVAGTVGQPLIGSAQNESNRTQIGFWYQAGSIFTGVEKTPDVSPTEFLLEQNYPNPFNPTTTIAFAIPKEAHVMLRIFDMLGRRVFTLVDDTLQRGAYRVVFDAAGLPSGIYFYRIEAAGFTCMRKLTLLK